MSRRWAKRVIIASLFLLAAAIGVLLFADTNPGHRVLRRLGEDALNRWAVSGHMDIGGLDGTIWGDLHLHEVRIIDRHGREAFRAREVRLRYGLRRLLRYRIDAVDVDQPRAHVMVNAGGEMNFAALIRLPQLNEHPFFLNRVRARDGQLIYENPSRTISLEEIQLTGTATIARERIEAHAALGLKISPGPVEQLELEVDVLETSAAIEVAIDRLTIDVPPAVWRARPMKVNVSPAGVSIRGVELTSSAGSIRASADLGPSLAALSLSIADLDVRVLRAFAPHEALLSRPLRVSSELSLADRRISLRAEVRDGAFARFSAAAQAIAPTNLFDRTAWLKETRLESAEARVERLELSRLLANTTTTASIAGVVDAALALRGERAHLRVRGHQVAFGKWVSGGSGTVELDVDARSTTASIAIAMQRGPARTVRAKIAADVGTRAIARAINGALPPLALRMRARAEKTRLGTITATVAAKLGSYARERSTVELEAHVASGALRLAMTAEGELAWKRPSVRGLRRVAGTLEGLDLQSLAALGLLPPRAQGALSTSFELGPALTSGRAELRGEGLIIDPRIVPLNIEAVVESTNEHQRVHSRIRDAKQTLLAIDGELGASIRAVLEDRWRTAPIALRAEGGFELGAIFTDGALQRGLDDHLTLRLELGGSAENPTAHVELSDHGRLDARVSLVRAHRELDAELTAEQFDFRFLEPLFLSFSGGSLGIEGILNGRLRLTGPMVTPKIDGALTIDRLRAVVPSAPVFEQGRLSVRSSAGELGVELEGKLGGGVARARLTGRHNPPNTELAGDVTLENVKALVTTEAITIDSTAHISAKHDTSGTAIDVTIGRTSIALPQGKKTRRLHPIQAFDDVQMVDVLGEKKPEPKLKEASKEKLALPKHLRMSLKLAEPTKIRGGSNDMEVTADLKLSTDGDRPELLGEAHVVRGRLALFGRPYDVERGMVTFDGSFPFDGPISVQLEHDFDTLTLRVILGGRLRKPELHFSAHPGRYSEPQLMAIFFGSDPDDAAGTNPEQMGNSVGGFLASQVAGTFTRKVGLDAVSFDTSEGSQSSGINVGKWLTEDIFLEYLHRFDPEGEENQNEGSLRWHLSRVWTLELMYGDHSTGEAEIGWLKRF